MNNDYCVLDGVIVIREIECICSLYAKGLPGLSRRPPALVKLSSGGNRIMRSCPAACCDEATAMRRHNNSEHSVHHDELVEKIKCL